MAKAVGLIPLRQKIEELVNVYGRVQGEIGSQLLSVEITDYQEMKSMRVQTRIDGLIKKLNRLSIRWVREAVPLAYKESFILAKKKLETFGIPEDKFFSPRTHKLTVEDFIEKTMEDLILANESIKTNVNLYLYLVRQASAGLAQLQSFSPEDEGIVASIISDAIEEGQARAYASKRIHEYLKLQLLDGQFINRAGRNFSLRDYSKMVARTRLRQAQTDAVKNTCTQFMNDLVQVSTHANPCDECASIEGQIYSLSGKHPVYPILDFNIPLHPNCEHDLSPTSEVGIAARGAHI